MSIIWGKKFMKFRFHQHLYKFGLLPKPTWFPVLLMSLCLLVISKDNLKAFISEPSVASVSEVP